MDLSSLLPEIRQTFASLYHQSARRFRLICAELPGREGSRMQPFFSLPTFVKTTAEPEIFPYLSTART
jgi:hypothetical protein